jgi:hypothetical protein
MKTQSKLKTVRVGKRSSRESGKAIAKKGFVVQEMKSTDTFAIHPIDTLLVGQLETLLEEERSFQDRYSHIDASANSIEVRMAFSSELAELKDRADRLYRLVNEMDHYGPYQPSYACSGMAA